MTKYNIIGIEIEVPTSTENYITISNRMKNCYQNFDSEFNKWYSLQGSCANVFNNYEDLCDKFLLPIIDKGIEILNEQGIYFINREIFHREYFGDSDEELYDAIISMMNEIYDIEEERQDAKEYRTNRKELRGKWVGGGFGVGGAIKGAVKAGAG